MATASVAIVSVVSTNALLIAAAVIVTAIDDFVVGIRSASPATADPVLLQGVAFVARALGSVVTNVAHLFASSVVVLATIQT